MSVRQTTHSRAFASTRATQARQAKGAAGEAMPADARPTQLRRRLLASGDDEPKTQAFLTQAVHQPLASTCRAGNSAHAPELLSGAP